MNIFMILNTYCHIPALYPLSKILINFTVNNGTAPRLEHLWPLHDHAMPDFRYSDSTFTFTYIGGPKRWACLKYLEEDLQDGRGVRRGHHLPPHKYIKNTSTCGTTPTELLLNAGRRPQTSQKPYGWQGLGAPAGCQAWASEVGELSSGHWTTRDLLAPHNISRQEHSQRSPSQH